MIEYFTQPSPPFGNISWTMVVVWAATLGFGVYLLRSYRDSNPIRSRFVRQVGAVFSALSAVGIGLLILKFFQVPVLDWRLWSYLVAFAWLGYGAFALYQYNAKLPAQIAAARPARSQRGVAQRGTARVYGGGATAAPRSPREPRPIATTTRREARRDKKRKGR